MEVFSSTDIGLIRSSNQDTYKDGVISDTCAWSVVCDGMGGTKGGNVASSIAVETIEKIITSTLNDDMPENEIRGLCFHAINEANSAVFSHSVDNPSLRGMGTTAVLAIVKNNRLYLSHVGDSRAYLKSSDGLKQVTVDHSYVQDLVARGEISQEEAKNHPHRNIITRSIGVHSMVENDYQELDFMPNDLFVSCSDGLSNYLSDEILNEFLEKCTKELITTALIKLALTSGGADNITVSVIYNNV